MKSLLEFNVGDTVLGRPFDNMADFITTFHRTLEPRAPSARKRLVPMPTGEAWRVNGFKLLAVSHEIGDGWALDRCIQSYGTKARTPNWVSPSRTAMDDRWKITLRFKEADGKNFELERQFTITDRHDKVIGKKNVKMQRHSIILEHKVRQDLVVREVDALYDAVHDVSTKTASISEWCQSGYDMLSVCRKCYNRSKLKSESLPMFFGDCTAPEEVVQKLRCSKCGVKGRADIYVHIEPIALSS